MIRRPPKSTRTDTLFPYTTLFRSHVDRPGVEAQQCVKLTGTNRSFGLIRSSAQRQAFRLGAPAPGWPDGRSYRSEEHTSELQSLMRISYAVFFLKKKKDNTLDIVIVKLCTNHTTSLHL